MPTFAEFSYIFALDVLKLSKLFIGLSYILGSLVVLAVPILYNKFMEGREYRFNFLFSQILTVCSTCMCLIQATRLNT